MRYKEQLDRTMKQPAYATPKYSRVVWLEEIEADLRQIEAEIAG